MQENKYYDPPILLYDDKCTLCRRFKLALEKIPGTNEINKISIHDENIYSIYPHLNFEQCHETLHLINSEGKTLKGPDALEFLINKFPPVRKFSWLYESNMGKKAIDIFYNVANNYRKSKLNRCGSCKN